MTVRLACVKHAASVRSEPESNSHVIFFYEPGRILIRIAFNAAYSSTHFFN